MTEQPYMKLANIYDSWLANVKIYIDKQDALKAALTQLPKRGQMWGDEMTAIVGGPVAVYINSAQAFAIWCVLGSYANADSAGWGFVCAAGNYTFRVLYAKTAASGIVDFYIDGVSVATGLDTYAAATAYGQTYDIAVTGLTAGYHTFKFIINGKHASSSSYRFYVTKVHFKKATD